MRIINALGSIQNCFPNGKFHLGAWESYVGAYSPHLAEKCKRDAIAPQGKYDFEKEILPVLCQAAASTQRLSQLDRSFQSAVNQLGATVGRLFPREPEVDIVLYLGLCNGAGWATELDGVDVILLGAEKIIELGWQEEKTMEALIFHELGHIWHKAYGDLEPAAHSPGECSLVQLYQEGVAMRCQQLLAQNPELYHQDKNGWLDWCRQNTTALKREYLRRMENNESTQEFFGDWCSYQGRSDAGYYLGCQFIKYLEQEHTLPKIAALSLSALKSAFYNFAK